MFKSITLERRPPKIWFELQAWVAGKGTGFIPMIATSRTNPQGEVKMAGGASLASLAQSPGKWWKSTDKPQHCNLLPFSV